MTQTQQIYNYGDRDLAEAMRQKGGVRDRRIERKAEQNAACNPHARRTRAGDAIAHYRNNPHLAAIGID